MSQPTPSPDPGTPEQLAQRLEALELASGFADRRSDDLAEQVLTLHGHVERLLRRVHTLEARLAALHETLDSAAAPPGPPADASGDQ
jgi:uncharacterized coiled-coil protein SlyX